MADEDTPVGDVEETEPTEPTAEEETEPTGAEDAPAQEPEDAEATPEEGEEPEGEGEPGDPEAEGDGEQLFDTEEYEQLDRDPGGPVPSKSKLVLKGGKKDVPNQFKQGDEVALLVHARCFKVSFEGELRAHDFEVLDIFEHGDPETDAAVAMMGDGSDPGPLDPEDEQALEDQAEVGEDAVEEASPEEGEPLDLSEPGSESVVEGEEEVVDGEIVDEATPADEAAAEAASDLEWT